jgi:sugar-specific transcriptional regulator TrmB
MQQTEKQLQELGLEEKEAKTYLACLGLGEATAFSISQKSGIKRSTTYFVLDGLVERGLVFVRKTKKATFFGASNPKKLLTQHRHKEKILQSLLPSLLASYKISDNTSNVQVFEGDEGVKQVYLEIIEHLKKKREAFFFGEISHFSEFQSLLEQWTKDLKRKDYKTKAIMNRSEADSIYVEKVKESRNPNHQIRFLPQSNAFEGNDNAIYGSKLAIFFTKKERFALVIDSQEIANSYKALFNLAWQQAKRNID